LASKAIAMVGCPLLADRDEGTNVKVFESKNIFVDKK
jgi:hypothetical protein